MTAALLALRRRAPGPLVAWLHAAVAVAPVSGIAHAGSQLVADRYSYLAGLGFAALAGGGVARAIEAWQRGRLGLRAVVAVTVAGLLVLTGLGAASWQASARWRDSVSLWRAAVAVDAECLLCRSKLGTALLAANAPGPAEPHLRRAVEDRKSTRLNSSHIQKSRMPSSA